jgi:hypothetical protein
LPASILSILQRVPDFKTLERQLWEKVAEETRAELAHMLAEVDAALMARRPSGLRHCGFKRRVIEGQLGPVVIQRRRYLEILPTGERRWRYLLDEALGLPPEVQVSPAVRDQAVEAAVQLPYREAAAQVRRLRPDGRGPSHGAIHRWVQQVGAQRLAVEAAQVRALREEGVLPPTAGARIETLFCEADDLRVALQRPKRRRRRGERLPRRPARRSEIRMLLCHQGWTPRHPASAEYQLAAKHVYAASAEAEDCWWGAVLSLHGYCQLEQVRWTVLNGDGAPWIRQGLAHLPHSEFQLDRWHLHQAIKAGVGWQPQQVRRLYGVLAGGADWRRIDRLLTRARTIAPHPEMQTAVDRLRGYLWANRDGLVDYRQRALPVAPDPAWRGLGAAEGNIDKPWARRLTKRGMSWSTGLAGMVRLMNLYQQGTLGVWLEVCGAKPFAPIVRDVTQALNPKGGAKTHAWLQVGMPALAGPRTQLHRTLRALSADR